jgi:hypothetical protein
LDVGLGRWPWTLALEISFESTLLKIEFNVSKAVTTASLICANN